MNWQEELETLEKRLRLVLLETTRLRQENQSLRTKMGEMASERAVLLHSRDEVRSRVESMIHRLKTLEIER
ncbi:MAG: TIGR02449 family protein [Gammaproteobacteria bacterium]